MALIKCPTCGKEVSDKAMECPFCSVKLKELPKPICVECGFELEEGIKICPKCGCPVEEENGKIDITKENVKQKDNKKAVKIIIGVAVLIIAIFIGINVKKANDEKRAAEEAAAISAEYSVNLYNATSKMFDGAVLAEKAGGLIHDVWYNTIYEKSDSTTNKYTKPDGYFLNDFNDALSNLFNDSAFTSDLSLISTNQTSVEELMKSLKNPPAEYDDAYDELNELYAVYLEFTNLALDPQGNLSSYTENFNDLDSEFVTCYNQMKIYLE